MTNSLRYKIKDSVDIDKHYLLEILFKGWVDESCDNQVRYNSQMSKTFQVEFENQEDAILMNLRGIPEEFQMYLEMIKSNMA